MTLALPTDARASMLDGFEAFMLLGSGTATLTVYQTNIALCVFNLAAAPFFAAVGPSLTLDAPITSTGTSVAGKANRFVIVNQDADEGLSGSISGIGGGGNIETANLTVTALLTSQRLNAFVLYMSPTGALSVEGSLTLV